MVKRPKGVSHREEAVFPSMQGSSSSIFLYYALRMGIHHHQKIYPSAGGDHSAFAERCKYTNSALANRA